VGTIGNEVNLKVEANGARGRVVGRMLALAMGLGLASFAWAQGGGSPPSAPVTAPGLPLARQAGAEVAPGSIGGVVVGPEGAVYEGATIKLAQSGDVVGVGAQGARSTTSDSNGHFNFAGVVPGAFELTVSASGFEVRKVSGVLHPGENYEAQAIVLKVNSAASEVRVTASQEEIAQEQLHVEETQRLLGVIPNFFVSYEANAAPLTAKQKFNLAWKSSIDPVTFGLTGAFAGLEQANNSFSGYRQGAQGYAKRYGANYADGFIGTMLGGAILPAWWKQDPRYFYKGTGTVRSRVGYAIANAVMCKGDNGHWQVDYSGLVGGLAAGGISNLYYPAANRNGAALTFENALIGTAESAVENLLQEFVLRKLTPHLAKNGLGTP
jgi:hypothetical protein